MDHFNAEEKLILTNSGLNNYPKSYVIKNVGFTTDVALIMHLAFTCQGEAQFYESLRCWNKMLASFPFLKGSAYVYYQRSLIYFEMKLYKQCLHNILMYVKTQPWTDFLKERRKYCDRAIDKHIKINIIKPEKEFLKLTYIANPKIPYIVNCLEINKSRNGIGYNITSTQDLKIGDIIGIENPFYTVLFSKDESDLLLNAEVDLVYKRCSHCYKDNFLDLIKCNECDIVMFCSTKCRENAFKMYHKYECFNMRIFPLDYTFYRSMRIFFYALYLFQHKIDDLKAFILSRGDERKTILDFDFSEFNPIKTGRNLLLCYDSLVTPKHCPEMQPFHLMFEHHPVLKRMWKKERVFIEAFLNRHFDIAEMFYYEMWKWPADTLKIDHEYNKDHGDNEDHEDNQDNQDNQHNQHNQDIKKVRKKVGDSYYVFASMFNHSCLPNVQLHCDINNKMHMIICQNVAKGEQLFVCLNREKIYFSDENKETRKIVLREDFGFDCTCPACVDDSDPIYSKQISQKTVLLKLVSDFDLHLHDCNVKQLRKQYAYLMKLLKENFADFSPTELSVLQNHAMTTLDHMSRPVHPYPSAK